MSRRLPRLLNAITTLSRNELGIFQRLACISRQGFNESTSIVVFAFVEPKRLFVQVSEQMKRFYI